MPPNAFLSITRTDATYVFTWRLEGQNTTLPIVALQPLTTETRQQLLQQIEFALQRFHHFYHALDTATAQQHSALTSDSDTRSQLKRLGRLIYNDLLPEPIRQQLKRLPTEQPLLLATNDAAFPWELAHDGAEHLGIQHSIGRQPQLTNVQPLPSHAITQPTVWKVLCIGDPTDDLPVSSREVAELADFLEERFPHVEVHVLCGPRATKEQVRAQLAGGNYRLIHYSGHARFDSNNPDQSGLLLYNGELLTAAEIRDALDGHPWIFLNACTSVQEEVPTPESFPNRFSGAGGHGLATTFLLAGAPAFVGTLWQVPDEGARRFALCFYAALCADLPIGEALRLSRNQLRTETPYDPVWSTYVLYGDPNLRLGARPATTVHRGTIVTVHLPSLPSTPDAIGALEARMAHIDDLLAQFTALVAERGGQPFNRGNYGFSALFAARSAQSKSSTPSFVDHQGQYALDCALAIQQFAAQGTTTWLPSAETLVIGVSEGVVVSSSDNRRILGPGLEQASALAALAQPGQILADAAVFESNREFFDAIPLQHDALSPLSTARQSETIYQVTARRIKYTETFTGPFIGRQQELQRLQQLWTVVQRGQGQVLHVIGEAGLGKSRLIYEFSQWLTTQAVTWFTIRALPSQQESLYALVAQLFRQLLALPENGEGALMQQQIEQKLRQNPHVAAQAVDESLALLVTVLGYTTMAKVHPNGDNHLAAIVRLLRLVLVDYLTHSPLVMVLEDLQYVDELSVQLLERLLSGIGKQPLFVIAIHRPEWQPVWSTYKFVATLTLDALTLDESILLLQTYAPVELADREANTIAQRTGGNPLFLLEMLRAYQQQSSTLAIPTALLDTVGVPKPIQSVVQGRVRLLPRATHPVLYAAAVLGVTFHRELLLLTLRHLQNEERIEAHLHVLESADFIQSEWGEPTLRFAHDILQEAIYTDIPLNERRHIHYQAAQAWATFAEEKAAATEPIAYHLYHSVSDGNRGQANLLLDQVSANVLERTAEATWQAGEQQRANHANATAQRYYTQTLTIIHALQQEASIQWLPCFVALGETSERIGALTAAHDAYTHAYELAAAQNTVAIQRQAADLARRIGRIHMHQSEWVLAHHWMQQALQIIAGQLDVANLPSPLSPEEQRTVAGTALIYIHTGSLYYWQGDYQAALASCQQGLALAEIAKEQTALAEGYNLAGVILDTQGRSQEALAYYERSHAVYTAGKDDYQLARVNDNIGTAYYYLGHWHEALRWHQKALTFWRETGDHQLLAFALLNCGMIYLYRGQWVEAETHFQEGLELCELVSNHRIWALAQTNLGLLCLEQQRLADARSHLQQSLTCLTAHHIVDLQVEVYCRFAEVALQEGNAEEGLQYAEQTVSMAREHVLQTEECIGLRLLGIVNYRSGDEALAQSCFTQSLAIAQDCNMLFEIGRTMVEMAKLALAQGNAKIAKEQLQQAQAIFEQLGATPMLACVTHLQMDLPS